MADIFDKVLALEEAAFTEGQQEGEVMAAEESYAKGLQQGRQLGEELGFYAGFVQGLLPAEQKIEHVTVHLQRALDAAQLELSEATLREVRAQFRALCSLIQYENPWKQEDELF